jgi:hypothetical protein
MAKSDPVALHQLLIPKREKPWRGEYIKCGFVNPVARTATIKVFGA